MIDEKYCEKCGGVNWWVSSALTTGERNCTCAYTFDMKDAIPYGWICPRCNAVNAPHIDKCTCPAFTITYGDNSMSTAHVPEP